MSKSEQPHNQDESPKADQPENVDMGRRKALTAGALVALGLSLRPGVAKATGLAKAAGFNPTQKALEPVLDRELGGKDTVPEKMEMAEILIMDEAMEVLFKNMFHFSFWSTLAYKGLYEKAKNDLETVMDHKNREKFLYKKNDNGTITIEKRNSGSPDVSIEIQRGLITKINDIVIDYKHWPIMDFDSEWREMEDKIKTISRKVIIRSMRDRSKRIDPITGRPPVLSDWENTYYSQYSMVMPGILQKWLQLKSDESELTDGEKNVKDTLDRLLKTHPHSMEEIIESGKEAERQGDDALIKKPTIIVLKRRAIKSEGQIETPNGVYEIARYEGSENAWETFAYVSKEGFVMEKKGNTLVKSDSRKTPFAAMTAKKMGLVEEQTVQLEDSCKTEVEGQRGDIQEGCSEREKCITDEVAKRVMECIAKKQAENR